MTIPASSFGSPAENPLLRRIDNSELVYLLQSSAKLVEEKNILPDISADQRVVLTDFLRSPNAQEKARLFAQRVCSTGRMYELSARQFNISFLLLLLEKTTELPESFAERLEGWIRNAPGVGPDESAETLLQFALSRQQLPKESAPAEQETESPEMMLQQEYFKKQIVPQIEALGSALALSQGNPQIVSKVAQVRIVEGENPKTQRREVSGEAAVDISVSNAEQLRQKPLESPTHAIPNPQQYANFGERLVTDVEELKVPIQNTEDQRRKGVLPANLAKKNGIFTPTVAKVAGGIATAIVGVGLLTKGASAFFH